MYLAIANTYTATLDRVDSGLQLTLEDGTVDSILPSRLSKHFLYTDGTKIDSRSLRALPCQVCYKSTSQLHFATYDEEHNLWRVDGISYTPVEFFKAFSKR